MGLVEFNQQQQSLYHQEDYQAIPKWVQILLKILRLVCPKLKREVEQLEMVDIHKWAAITYYNKLTHNKTLMVILAWILIKDILIMHLN